MGSIELLPGLLGKDCSTCTYQGRNEYPFLNYPCNAVRGTSQGKLIPPEITSIGGSVICEGYQKRPDLKTSLRQIYYRLRPFIDAFQSHLPQ